MSDEARAVSESLNTRLLSKEKAEPVGADDDDDEVAGIRTEAARRSEAGLTSRWSCARGEGGLESAAALSVSEGGRVVLGKGMWLGLSALSSEALGGEESGGAANGASNASSSQSISSSRLMKERESGSELNGALGSEERAAEEAAVDDKLAASGVTRSVEVEAGGRGSISGLRGGRQQDAGRAGGEGCGGGHDGQKASRLRRGSEQTDSRGHHRISGHKQRLGCGNRNKQRCPDVERCQHAAA